MRSWLFLIIVSLFLSAPAIASEQGQYRPGHSYLRAPAHHPDICASQCAGDALCKSWNFVRVNTPSGAICEFNARLVTPVPYAMSISGLNPASWDSSRIVPAGYRTTRVGQTMTQPQARQQNTIRVGQVPAQYNATAQRRAVPAPLIRKIQQSNPAPAPAPVQMSAPLPKTNAAPHHMRTANVYSANAVNEMPSPQIPYAAVPEPAAALNYPANQRIEPQLDEMPRPVANPASDMRRPEPPAQAQNNAVSSPEKSQSGLTPISQIPATPMRRPIAESGLAGAPILARQSLYGSLHDDVKIPRALTPADIPDDPDAPIPTVRSVPVGHIDQGNL
ncbi:MAG: hypothetical protein HKN36_05760 [Hellea sp.]|nr:hypothetical protein [Hellea sp.]